MMTLTPADHELLAQSQTIAWGRILQQPLDDSSFDENAELQCYPYVQLSCDIEVRLIIIDGLDGHRWRHADIQNLSITDRDLALLQINTVLKALGFSAQLRSEEVPKVSFDGGGTLESFSMTLQEPINKQERTH